MKLTNATLLVDRRSALKMAVVADVALSVSSLAQANKPSMPNTESKMDIEITRNGSQPSSKGPADWFSGTTRIDPLFAAKESARAAAALVTFEPGRSNGVAHASAGANVCRHLGLRLGATRGWPGSGNSAGRRGLVSAGPQALARRYADYRHVTRRDSRASQRQGRRLDGEGQRCAISALIPKRRCHT